MFKTKYAVNYKIILYIYIYTDIAAIFFNKWTKKVYLVFFILITICGFKPSDIVYKNINLIPEQMDDTDRYIHLPSSYNEEKSEKLHQKFNFDIGKSEDITNNAFSIKPTLKEITNGFDVSQIFSDGFVPTADSVNYMFNLNNIGINTLNTGGVSLSPSYLEKDATQIPILNNFQGMPYMYNSETPVVQDIEGIQAPGLDDVLPTSVGESLKADINVVNVINFSDFITPDKVVSGLNFVDLLP